MAGFLQLACRGWIWHGWQADAALNVTVVDCMADSVNVLRFRWWHAR